MRHIDASDLHLARRKLKTLTRRAAFDRWDQSPGHEMDRQPCFAQSPGDRKIIRQRSSPLFTHADPLKRLTQYGGRTAPAEVAFYVCHAFVDLDRGI